MLLLFIGLDKFYRICYYNATIEFVENLKVGRRPETAKKV